MYAKYKFNSGKSRKFENPGISGKSEFRKCRENFGFRELFRISEILKRGTFRKISLFYKTALRSSVHIIKISVKLVEIVFFSKILRKCPRPEIPEIREKKWFFPVFPGRKDTAYF
jgi:hypothetical protein